MKLRGLEFKVKVQKMLTCLMVFMLFGLLWVAQPGTAGADPFHASGPATSLTFRVGYSGGTFTTAKVFTDNDFAGAVQQGYSFMDSMPSPGMEAAKGVPLTNLLSKAGIDFNKVDSFKFYVTDVPDVPYKTLTKSFLYSPLFYYPNIMKCWNTDTQSFTDANGNDTISEAVYGAIQVYPMMCISDNWVRGAMAPDFSRLDKSNKYRLVIGQPYNDPVTISAPNIAKWVYQIDVVLSGKAPDTIPVSGVALNKTSANIGLGGSEQLTATITPDKATNQSVTWSSSNTAVATVSNTGLVKAVAKGEAKITATTADGGFTATCVVTVNNNSGGGGGGAAAPQQQQVKSTTGEATIDPVVGGTISLGSDAMVSIPAGALSGTTGLSIAIKKVSSPPSPPSGFMLPGSVFEFTVGGNAVYKFAKPVTLTFTFNPASLSPGETPSVHYYDEASSKWVNLGGSVSGNTITVTVSHFTKYAVFAGQKAAGAPVVQNPPDALNEPDALDDIAGHWAENNIKKLVTLGAIGGYPDGSFKADAAITRAEFATVLAKAFKLALQSGKVFADTNGHWAKEYIATAASCGIVSGYDESAFGPDDLITREQMAVMIVKAAKLAPATGEARFEDSGSISGWARDAVATATENGVMKGYPDNTVQPQGNATRAEAVTVILNALK